MDYGTIDFTYAASLANRPEAEDGPIWMVNFMRYKEVARYDDSGEEISGKEADDRYAPVDVLNRIGAVVAYFGDVIDGDDTWDRMAIVRYPTRRSFIEMQERQDFKEKRVHKDAGMAFTIIMCSLPEGPMHGAGDGSGVVQFIGYPAGTPRPDPLDGSVQFSVEGTVIGDERRWDHLVVVYAESEIDDLPEGAMVVRSRATIDQINQLS
jgi:hypothetical protein